MMKTRQFTVIYSDATYTHEFWGGNAAELRRSIESRTGKTVTLIFKQIMHPLWARVLIE